MEAFDLDARFGPDANPDTARLRDRMAKLRGDIDRFTERNRPSRGQAGTQPENRAHSASTGDPWAVNPELRDQMKRLAERTAMMRRGDGRSGVDTVAAAVARLEAEREATARRRALRGTVAFDRAETRPRLGGADRKEAGTR